MLSVRLAWHIHHESNTFFDKRLSHRYASRYHKGVYGCKRADLITALDSTLFPLFLGQLKNLHKSCLVAFKKEMLDGLRGESYSFADVAAKARRCCEGNFANGAKEALVEDTDWSWEDELQLLKEEVGVVADQCRKDETKKMLNQIEVCRYCFVFDLTEARFFSFIQEYQEADFGTG